MTRHGSAVVLILVASAAPAHAQFTWVDKLFANTSDIGFYIGTGNVMPASSEIQANRFGVSSFGVELLFSLGQVTRPKKDARDTTVLQLREVKVVRGRSGPDTTYTYVPESKAAEREALWSFEFAFGYGQIAGIQLEDESLDMHVTLRELPSVTFYALHERSGAYLGVRSGLIETHALQIYDAEGDTYSGKAQAFQVGGAVGYTHSLGEAFPFVEAAYMVRRLPSIEWKTTPLPPQLPRDLNLSGWQLQLGIQVPLKW